MNPRTDPAGAPPRPAARIARLLAPRLWPADPALRLRVVAALAALLAAKLVAITVPFWFKGAVDELSAPAPVAGLAVALVVAYALARLLAAGFDELRDAIFARVAERAGRTLAREVYEHLFRLSLRFHLDKRTGELARAVDRGVQSVTFLLGSVLFGLVPTLLEFALVLAVLLWNYPPAWALSVFLTIAAYAGFTLAVTEWRTQFRREMNRRQNEFSATAVDGLVNYEVVKAFGNERLEVARLDRSLAAYEDAAVRSEVSLAALNAGQAAIIGIGMAVLMLLAAHGVLDGSRTVGDVVLVNAFLLQLYRPLDFLGVIYRQLRQAVTDLEHIDRLLHEEPEVRDPPGARPLVLREGGRVVFADVHFAYDPRRPILGGVSFEIAPGRRLAVVGPSGAGKSTIVRLLFRFYDPVRGRILIDGQDIRTVTQESLRAVLGLVPQDTVLFNDTIAANIAYGRPGASMEEIRRAARIAQLDAFIEGLPDGYDTLVGERGLKLSGGEKQRLAIARVVLRDPAILVLDEATSSLDSRTEKALQEALARAASGRTTLMIAHRLSTVVDADEILVLDHGRVVERGTHRELLARGGLYAEMWARQQRVPAGDGELAASRETC